MTGKQVPLSPRGTPESPANEAAALAAWERMEQDPGSAPPADPDPAKTSRFGPTVGQAVASYLAWAEARVRVGRMTAGCFKGYRNALRPFAAAFGGRPLASLAPEEIEEWAAGPHPHPWKKGEVAEWSSSTQNDHLGVVLQVFKKTKCPIRLEVPPKESRGAAVVLTDEQFARVLALVGTGRDAGDLAALLRALRETGARPGELSRLTAEMVDWPNGVVQLHKHKTKRKTGRPRLIVLTAAALAVLQGQREKYGRGLLFRGRAGAAYTDCAIGRRLRRAGRVLGFRVMAYGLRHSFATEALKRGVPDAVVAALLGHAGTRLLHQHYQHLGADSRAMKEAAERATARQAS